jgi:hypothetical protein
MFTKRRPDGTYLKDIPHFTKLLPYMMPTRAESVIFFEQEMDVTEAMRYVRAANADGIKRLTLFQLFLTATVRTIALRPKLNRFVAGLRYYQRNRIAFNFVAKRELTDEGAEVNVTMAFAPDETLATLPAKVSAYVNRVRSGAATDADDLNALLAKLPRWAIRLFIRLLFWLDYHNGLPFSFIKDMPFFATVFFTNVGSVGVDAPFHHNFEFGSCGLFAAIGKIRKVVERGSDGTESEREKVKVTFTYDDRITDGIYCGRAIDLLRSFVENPGTLEAPPELTPELLAELALLPVPAGAPAKAASSGGGR